MNKRDVARALSNRTDLSIEKCEKIMSELFGIIERQVANGEVVVFSDFGVFKKVKRRARKIAGLISGQSFTTKEHHAPKFSAGKRFRNMTR